MTLNHHLYVKTFLGTGVCAQQDVVSLCSYEQRFVRFIIFGMNTCTAGGGSDYLLNIIQATVGTVIVVN